MLWICAHSPPVPVPSWTGSCSILPWGVEVQQLWYLVPGSKNDHVEVLPVLPQKNCFRAKWCHISTIWMCPACRIMSRSCSSVWRCTLALLSLMRLKMLGLELIIESTQERASQGEELAPKAKNRFAEWQKWNQTRIIPIYIYTPTCKSCNKSVRSYEAFNALVHQAIWMLGIFAFLCCVVMCSQCVLFLNSQAMIRLSMHLSQFDRSPAQMKSIHQFEKLVCN